MNGLLTVWEQSVAQQQKGRMGTSSEANEFWGFQDKLIAECSGDFLQLKLRLKQNLLLGYISELILAVNTVATT